MLNPKNIRTETWTQGAMNGIKLVHTPTGAVATADGIGRTRYSLSQEALKFLEEFLTANYGDAIPGE